MKAGLWISASIGALMVATVAQAQAAPTPPTTDPTAAAKSDAEPVEIVVTAERRATNLQRTAVAATVLTGADLVQKSVNTVDQLQFASPSLTVNNSGQGNQFNIRGIGKGELGSTIGVGVVTYRDGVATFPGYFQSEPYYDIASVEVLRGPQGTFAGGNATGGAVFITEAAPSLSKVGGFVTAQYGNYNDVKVQGALNLPLSDTLAVRFATSDERRDSFYHISGPWTGNPGNLRAYSGRVSLLWQPDSHLRVLIKGDYNNINQGGYPASPASVTIGGVVQPNPTDPFHIASNAYLQGKDDFGRIVANISYTTDGGVVLRSITGYQKGTVTEHVDTDGNYDPTSAATLARTSQIFSDDISERIWSQEFNIVSPNKGPFTWLVGGYYQNDYLTIPVGTGYNSTAVLETAGGPILYNSTLDGTNPKTALAAFAQVGYQLTDRLQITVGGRWSRTTSRNDAFIHIPLFAALLNPAFANVPQHDFTANKKVNGKIALNYQLDGNNFLYAFVATGSKAGGLNSVNASFVTPKPFGLENVTDYEAGWKGTWLGGHVRTQLGGYYNRYTGFQVTIVDPNVPAFNSILNVPNPTKLYGVEFSTQASIGQFGFDFSTALSHSSIGQFYAFDPRVTHSGVCNAQSGPATATGCVALGGRQAVYAPKFTLSAGAQYVFALGGDMTLTPRVDFSHTSAVWATLFEVAAFGDHLDARNLVNAQLTLASGPWSIAGYATNLTNQHYIAAINSPRRLAGLPRQFGIRASRSF